MFGVNNKIHWEFLIFQSLWYSQIEEENIHLIVYKDRKEHHDPDQEEI